MQRWTSHDIPDQTGRVAVVTGSNTGIGFETAAALAVKGAMVVMACRSIGKAEGAVSRILERTPDAKLEIIELDLASLASVRRFADDFGSRHNRLDLLINNAGVMVPPFKRTADGFELQFGCNHLGHFALTGRLIDLIQATPDSRIVTVSSMAHKVGKIDFDNLNAERAANKAAAYGQSKLANLLFTFELQRRLEAAGSKVVATAAHPGWTGTDLQRHTAFVRFFNTFFAQPPTMGALPTLRAATDPDARGGDYFGPRGFLEMRGYPVRVEPATAARNGDDARALWTVSERLTEVSYLSGSSSHA